MPKIALLVPFYNETQDTTIRSCEQLKSLSESIDNIALLFVNDGSCPEYIKGLESASSKILSGFDFQIVSCSQNRGYGGAINYGLEKLMENNFDWAIIADSELSMRNEDLLLMHESILHNASAIAVKATRYQLPGGFSQIHGKRKILSYLGREISRLLTLRLLSDPTTGFRALNLDHINLEKRRELGFSSIAEELKNIFISALKYNKKIVQTTYVYQVRKLDDRNTSFSYQPRLIYSYLKYCVICFFVLTREKLVRKSVDVVDFYDN